MKNIIMIVCLFVTIFLIKYGELPAQDEFTENCKALVATSDYFEGSLLMATIQSDTRDLILVDQTGNSRNLGAGYYNTQTFYNSSDQTVLIWIRARNDQEDPRSDEPDTLELWSLVTNELIATTPVPSSYLPIQRLPDGKLIVFNWDERVFFTLNLMPDREPINNNVVAENELPDAIGVSLVSRSFAEFAFSPDLHYVAHKVRGLQLAVYDLWEKKEIWRSPPVPQGALPISHPTWNSTSDRLIAALFVEDEMQLFLIDPVSKMHVQRTHFSPDPNYGKPGMIPPGSHLSGITWSPNDRYVAFVQSGAPGLHVLDTKTMTITMTCEDVGPLFWSGQGDQLFVIGNGLENSIQMLDLNTSQAYPILPKDTEIGQVIGWSPQAVGE
jgi:WD40 repeat protein